MRQPEKITHKELCEKTAKRFMDKIAIYDYQSAESLEQPDVLILSDETTLFEIKISYADFQADKYKEARKKYRLPHWARYLEWCFETKSPFLLKKALDTVGENDRKARFKFVRGEPEIELVEREHLGNRRYFVCPDGIVPVEKIPEGWGLYYYKGGKFYLKRKSAYFRSDIKAEYRLALHALRRFASGDNTGILINTYIYDPRRRKIN
jgi:hypothetical protein